MKRLTLMILLMTAAEMVFAQQDSIPTWPIDTVNGTAVWRYRVEKSIGLYRISKNFGVTQEDIIRWNPQLKDRGLHFEEELLIPVTAEWATKIANAKANANVEPVTAQPTEPAAPVKTLPLKELPETAIISAKPAEELRPIEKITPDTLPVIAAIDSLAHHDTLTAKPVADSLATKQIEDSLATPRIPILPPLTGEVIRLAFLLPLQADVAQRDPNMDRFYEFYTGALIAVYEAQQSGLKIEVRTFDIGKSNDRLQAILLDTALWQCDAVIGPAFPTEIAMAAPYALENRTPMLIPFSPNVPGIENNPYLLQYNSSDEDEAIAMAQHIADMTTGVKCIEIDAKDEDIPMSVRDLRNALHFYRVPSDTITIRAILNDSLASKLSSTAENFLIFNTERYSNLHVLMPHLIPLAEQYRLTLISHYAWQKEKVALPQIYTTTFIPDTDVQDSTYMETYQRYFAHRPETKNPRYDLLGYDLTRYMLLILPQLRENAEAERISEIIALPYLGLQSDLRFERLNATGGYRNKALKILRSK